MMSLDTHKVKMDASKRLVAVVAAFVIAVALALILLEGGMREESSPQSSRSVSTEETSLEEGQESQTRQARQQFDHEAFQAKMLERWCTNRGSTVMKDSVCDRYTACEGTDSFCLLSKCCCKAEVCNCSKAFCRAAPDAVKHCENEGKCTKECTVKFYLKGMDITSFCESSSREEVEDKVTALLCKKNCPFEDKPCLHTQTSCSGAPHATCENRCDGECVAHHYLSGVDITGYCYLSPADIQSYVEYVQAQQEVTVDPKEGDQVDISGSGSGPGLGNSSDSVSEEVEDMEDNETLLLCKKNCPFEDKPCLHTEASCVGAPHATCENRCDGECEAHHFLSGVDITGYCYLNLTDIESYVEYIKTQQEVTVGSGLGNSSDSVNEEVEDMEDNETLLLCKKNCPFEDKPCLHTEASCVGAPHATCENRCDGECEAHHFLSGVDITGYCYLNLTDIESYVEYIKTQQEITVDPKEGESGSGSGSGFGISSDSISGA